MAFVHTPDLEELGDHHSVVLGCNDLNSFFVCDTNHGGLWGTIDSIADLGRVGHGMLIVERN